ncbi:MAG: hypothetical protein Q4B30_06795 [Coriobacteriaceae bacterium]|nr:hypothetical protein [Coriobacteriaceae bacterium]
MATLAATLGLDEKTNSRFHSIIKMKGYSESEALKKLICILVDKGGFTSLEKAEIPDWDFVSSEEEAMDFLASLRER